MTLRLVRETCTARLPFAAPLNWRCEKEPGHEGPHRAKYTYWDEPRLLSTHSKEAEVMTETETPVEDEGLTLVEVLREAARVSMPGSQMRRLFTEAADALTQSEQRRVELEATLSRLITLYDNEVLIGQATTVLEDTMQALRNLLSTHSKEEK